MTYNHLPLIINWADTNPLTARIEMMMNRGLQIIAPDFIMPKFELEPFTQDELREIYGYKRKVNISKFRSIIRKAKQNA
jgi:hypothetical protein